jgi:MOSC domain-containing protein YiiM
VPRIVSVNVGTPRQISVRRGRPMMSAIYKAPVEGPVRVEGINLAGDLQADRRVHGGPDKAVYAYAREDSDWWALQLGREIADGMFGENLTVEGLDISGAVIGERWKVGAVEFEVCQPRLPCSKLGLRFEDLKMVKRFGQASRPGAYLRIVTEGELQAGDEVTVLSRPEHGITLANVADAILVDDSLLAHAASAPELPADLAEAMLRGTAA